MGGPARRPRGRGGAGAQGARRLGGQPPGGERGCRICGRPVLAEIYLRDDCSCHAIEGEHAVPGQGEGGARHAALTPCPQSPSHLPACVSPATLYTPGQSLGAERSARSILERATQPRARLATRTEHTRAHATHAHARARADTLSCMHVGRTKSTPGETTANPVAAGAGAAASGPPPPPGEKEGGCACVLM
eukprot:COSAG01_NODE_1043_length_11954_cov_9.077014_4_plen_191_part_00